MRVHPREAERQQIAGVDELAPRLGRTISGRTRRRRRTRRLFGTSARYGVVEQRHHVKIGAEP
jgi:hypothetical protein